MRDAQIFDLHKNLHISRSACIFLNSSLILPDIDCTTILLTTLLFQCRYCGLKENFGMEYSNKYNDKYYIFIVAQT